jgi:hypothetical protein
VTTSRVPIVIISGVFVAATEEVPTMLTTIQSANLALRFGLEMTLLAVVGLSAWRSFGGRRLRPPPPPAYRWS